MSGYVHVYTGNGKGKTTAAIGLAIRAAGAGLKVFIAQFAKGMDYSELHSIARYSDQISLKQYGRNCFIVKTPAPEDISRAQAGFAEVRDVVASGEHDLVILDEMNIATHFGLFSVNEVLDLIDSKPDNMEMVITGRYAHELVIRRADLVTEMREVKHYYSQGVLARAGIEN